MWLQLTPSEKAKLLGQSALGIGMLALAAALVYATYQTGTVWQSLPDALTRLDKTTEKLQPAVNEVESVRKLIPPILEEVKAVRKLVPPTLAEVKAVREALPPVVKEVSEVRKTLPPLVNASATSLREASNAVLVIEPHINPVLEEVKNTREALPGIIDQADKVVGRASSVGKEASQGAVQGVFSGIILSPFRLIGDAGKGLFGVMGLDAQSGLNAKDERMAAMATQEVLKTGKIGAKQIWRNEDSNNSGSALLVEQNNREGMNCYTVRHHVVFATKKTYDADINMCQQPDGEWVSPRASTD